MSHPQDYSTLQDRSQEATSLLGHKVFQEAVESLRAGLFERLAALPVNDPKVLEMHARIKLLEELMGELRSFVNAARMKRKPET